MRETSVVNNMRLFWQELNDANEILNGFISQGMPTATEKRLRPFVRQWEKMKERATELCDKIEQSDMNIEPVEINLPWQDDTFAKAWQDWKDYLTEQHNRRMKSRMERAALNHLKNISEDEATAIKYLNFAMATGYSKFFKVTEKDYKQPTQAGGRGDGDF